MGSLDSNTNSITPDPPKQPNSTMKVAILALLCVALVASQDVPDLCQPCIRILTEADYPSMIAFLEKDLVDKQICFKGGQICIEVDATVEETVNLAISLLKADTDPTELCTLAGICGDY